jgi:hypothetical protein
MDYSTLKTMVEETIPWVKDSGLSAEVLEARHVGLRLPKDRHPRVRPCLLVPIHTASTSRSTREWTSSS